MFSFAQRDYSQSATTDEPNASNSTSSDQNAGAVVTAQGASPKKVCAMCTLPSDVRLVGGKNTNAGSNTTINQGTPTNTDPVETGN